MFAKMEFDNKVVIVTGGSRGIGRAIVEQFVATGAKVYFFYLRDTQAALNLVEQLAAPGRVSAMQVDVRDHKSVQATVQEIFTLENRIDILVNNSGVVRDGLLPSLSSDDLHAVIDTNLFGVFYVTQAVVPFMLSQRAGKIINISSAAAGKGGRGQTHYAASKGAIDAFTRALAVELAKRKINVNAVAPGVIETDMSKEVRDLAEAEILAEILCKRFGKVQEVAYAVMFLASKYADYINGEILHVDGGFKMG